MQCAGHCWIWCRCLTHHLWFERKHRPAKARASENKWWVIISYPLEFTKPYPLRAQPYIQEIRSWLMDPGNADNNTIQHQISHAKVTKMRIQIGSRFVPTKKDVEKMLIFRLFAMADQWPARHMDLNQAQEIWMIKGTIPFAPTQPVGHTNRLLFLDLHQSKPQDDLWCSDIRKIRKVAKWKKPQPIKPIYLREPQHTPGALAQARNSLVGGSFWYVPGVCWQILRIYWWQGNCSLVIFVKSLQAPSFGQASV